MEEILTFIQAHVNYAPYAIFGLLLLAGLNLPVSEDAMIFVSAVLAASHPEHFTALFLGVFMGAYCSDLISYWLGRLVGPKLWRIKFVERMVSFDKIGKVQQFYDKYGIFTLIIGRFIPFGVRNAMFLTAGLSKMNFMKFALSDLLATTISCSFFFYIYYTYGPKVIEYVQKGNAILITLFALGVFIFWQWQKRKSAARQAASALRE